MQIFKWFHFPDIIARQQPLKLFWRQGNDRVGVFLWPREPIFFEAFLPKSKSRLIKIEDLNPVSALATEYEQVGPHQIPHPSLENDLGQAVDRLPHIDGFTV
jgi:hypothetical protein